MSRVLPVPVCIVLFTALGWGRPAAAAPICTPPTPGATIEALAEAVNRLAEARRAGEPSADTLVCARQVVAAAERGAWPAGVARRSRATRPALVTWPSATALALYAAELRWRAAETAPPATASLTWRAAAASFFAISGDKTAPASIRVEASHDAVEILGRVPRAGPRRATDGGAVLIEPADRFELASYNRFLALAPAGDGRRVMVRYLRGRWNARFDRLDEAIADLGPVVEQHPATDAARFGASLLLDVLVRKKDFDALVVWVERMLAMPALVRHDDLRTHLERIRMQARRKRAEALELAQDYSGCARAYLEIANSDPDGRHADEVLYNAGVCAELAHSVGIAIAVLERLRRRHPKSRLAQKAFIRLGNLYSSITRYAQAASIYEQYARRYGGEKDAPDALSEAIVLRRALGQDEQVIANTELFARFYGKKMRRESAEALFALAHEHERRGTKALITHLRRYLGSVGSAGGRARVVVAKVRLGVLLWEAGCRRGSVAGLCRRARASRGRVEARRQLTRALAMTADPREPHERALLEHWRSRARLVLADMDGEPRLRGATAEARSQIVATYMSLAGTLSPTDAIGAMLRVAVIEENAGDSAGARAACARAARAAPKLVAFPAELAICDRLLARAAPHLAAPREAHGASRNAAAIIDDVPMVTTRQRP